MSTFTLRIAMSAVALAACALHARADVVTDWNAKSHEIIGEARLGTPPATRVVAIVQTAVFDAATAAAQRAQFGVLRDWIQRQDLDWACGLLGEAVWTPVWEAAREEGAGWDLERAAAYAMGEGRLF